MPEPHVGIFWLYRDQLIIADAPLDKAERGIEFLDYPQGHVDYWAELQRTGVVFPEVEYEEFPRGRVVYNSKLKRFILRADECILSRPTLVAEIIRRLHLPKDSELARDDHYRCFTCLYGSNHDDDE